MRLFLLLAGTVLADQTLLPHLQAALSAPLDSIKSAISDAWCGGQPCPGYIALPGKPAAAEKGQSPEPARPVEAAWCGGQPCPGYLAVPPSSKFVQPGEPDKQLQEDSVPPKPETREEEHTLGLFFTQGGFSCPGGCSPYTTLPGAEPGSTQAPGPVSCRKDENEKESPVDEATPNPRPGEEAWCNGQPCHGYLGVPSAPGPGVTPEPAKPGEEAWCNGYDRPCSASVSVPTSSAPAGAEHPEVTPHSQSHEQTSAGEEPYPSQQGPHSHSHQPHSHSHHSHPQSDSSKPPPTRFSSLPPGSCAGGKCPPITSLPPGGGG